MTTPERAADVAKYDRGVAFEKTRPLTASDRAKWERAKAARREQSTGDDVARILIALEPKLLAKAHARAKREGKTLSALVSDLLRGAERRPAARSPQVRHRLPA